MIKTSELQLQQDVYKKVCEKYLFTLSLMRGLDVIILMTRVIVEIGKRKGKEMRGSRACASPFISTCSRGQLFALNRILMYLKPTLSPCCLVDYALCLTCVNRGTDEELDDEQAGNASGGILWDTWHCCAVRAESDNALPVIQEICQRGLSSESKPT